jgi:hypothetical protein
MSATLKHLTLVLEFSQGQYQATCGCGWTSTISYFEEVDLLRAMHAHAVVAFKSYKSAI